MNVRDVRKCASGKWLAGYIYENLDSWRICNARARRWRAEFTYGGDVTGKRGMVVEI